MKRGLQGQYQIVRLAGESYKRFLPAPLPPAPPLQMSGRLEELREEAVFALGRLDAVQKIGPAFKMALYYFIRREAVLTSMIEGTQSSLSDLLLFENALTPGVPLNDVSEVSNYVAAAEYGFQEIKNGNPLTNRLIRELHHILLRTGRGQEKNPGEWRYSQNWIGGTRPGNAIYVPPSHEDLPLLMSDLERFVNDIPAKTPALLKAGFAHAQFESIHPFLDGNGRLGRLLIALILCKDGLLSQPVLYPSLYIKQNRQRYYWLLEMARKEGMWEEWFEFLFEAVKNSCNDAVDLTTQMQDIHSADRQRIAESDFSAPSLFAIHELLQQSPILSPTLISERLSLSKPTVSQALQRLTSLGIVDEVTGKQRKRIYRYTRLVDALNAGTEPF